MGNAELTSYDHFSFHVMRIKQVVNTCNAHEPSYHCNSTQWECRLHLFKTLTIVPYNVKSSFRGSLCAKKDIFHEFTCCSVDFTYRLHTILVAISLQCTYMKWFQENIHLTTVFLNIFIHMAWVSPQLLRNNGIIWDWRTDVISADVFICIE